MKSKIWVPLILAVLFLIVLIQNTQVVTLRLFFWKISMSQIILIPLTILIGFAGGYIVARITSHRKTRKLHGGTKAHPTTVGSIL